MGRWQDSQLLFDLKSVEPSFEPLFDPLNVLSEAPGHGPLKARPRRTSSMTR